MTERRNPHEEPIDRFLVERFAPRGAAAGPCPDPNLLAGFAQQRLEAEERDKVVEHVAECARCRTIVARVVSEDRRPARRPVLRLALGAVAAAALVVLAFTLFSGPESTDDALRAAAREIALGDFRPLSRKERLEPGDQRRGLLTLLYPSGRVIEARPRFRWEQVAGVTSYTLALIRTDGMEMWREQAEGTTLEFPKQRKALEPGAGYVWEVSCRGPLGDEKETRRFSVASADERASFDQGMRKIASKASDGIAPLLQAHYAVRERFYGEAEKAARAFVKAEPDDQVGRETLFQVLQLLGSSEANGLLEERDG